MTCECDRFRGDAGVDTRTDLTHALESQGHQVAAGLALAQFTPKARADLDRLLAQKTGETPMSICTWADEPKIVLQHPGIRRIFRQIHQIIHMTGLYPARREFQCELLWTKKIHA